MAFKHFFVILCCFGPGLARGQYYDITRFGAKAGVAVNNAPAIQKAIDKCARTGGTVVIPPGRFQSGTIRLRSHVTLRVENGAVLLGSPFLKDYPVNRVSVRTRPPHKPNWPAMPSRALIYADSAQQVSIDGEGTIDGNGASPEFLTQDDDPNRPKLLMFVGCRNVSVQHVLLTNSAFWMQHYFACDGVTIHGLRVYNHNNLNNDGLDLDSKNVTVSDCTIDCDDDGICLKSDGFDPVENVVITNCVVASNCNFIKLGTASYSGFQNIAVSNCVFRRASASQFNKGRRGQPGVTDSISGLAGIALEAVDGGRISHVTVNNVSMTGVQTPLFIKLGSRRNPPGTIEHVLLSNIVATGASWLPSSITGVPGHDVQHVVLENITLISPGGATRTEADARVPENEGAYPENNMFGYSLPASGLYLRHVRNLTLSNVRLLTEAADARPAIVQEDAKNVTQVNVQLFDAK